jgi:hypothetical protein
MTEIMQDCGDYYFKKYPAKTKYTTKAGEVREYITYNIKKLKKTRSGVRIKTNTKKNISSLDPENLLKINEAIKELLKLQEQKGQLETVAMASE